MEKIVVNDDEYSKLTSDCIYKANMRSSLYPYASFNNFKLCMNNF